MMNETTPEQVKAERDGARWLYLLSLCSPLLLLTSACIGLFGVLLVLLVLALVVAGFFSKHAFVRWHTGQWTLLTVPTALLAFWRVNSIFGSYYDSFSENACFFLIVLGCWYVGNIVGLRQINQGRCWLWNWLAPTTQLPRPWAALPGASTASVAAPAPSAALSFITPSDPQMALLKGQSLVNTNQRPEAVECFLSVFHNGPPDLRQQAVVELEKLGEVETF